MADAIGILGGTFDPIHFGHLRAALDVAEQLNLDRVHLIPSATPPHREQPQANAKQRVALLQLAIKNNEHFIVDDRECHREGASYTIDTLISLRQEFPDSPLYLMIGTDAFAHIQTWQRWDELLDYANIVVMQRASSDDKPSLPPELTTWYQQHLSKNKPSQQGVIYPVKVTQLEISATKIRTKITQGQSPQFLLPDAVIQLIDMLGLYKS